MSSPLLLDGLLLLVVLLFIPIGLWRGGVREAVVAGGILLGGELAAAWARPWGDDLANQLDLRPQVARFVVAVAALLGTTLCIGYLGGGALRLGAPGLLGRMAGGLLAGVNGLLLLGYGLGFLDQYVLERRSVPMLSDGFVAKFLLHQFGWLLLLLIAIILPVILMAAVSQVARGEHVDEPVEAVSGDVAMVAGSVMRPRPVRVPHSADAGKVEPVHRHEARPEGDQNAGGRLTDMTTGLRASDLSMSDRTDTPPPPLRPRPDQSTTSREAKPLEAGEATRPGAVIVDEWLRRATWPSVAPPPDKHQAGDGEGTDSTWERRLRRDTPESEYPSPGAWSNSAGRKNTGRPPLHLVGSSPPDGSEEIGSGRAQGDDREPDTDVGDTREARRCRSCNAKIDATAAYCSTCGSLTS